MITHTIESYWIQVKRRQSQSYKFKKIAKIANFWISKRALHATQLLKLLAKMCKYEIDPMSIVEDTERTRFCPQTDRRTRWYQYTPFQLRWSGGYNNTLTDGLVPIWHQRICNNHDDFDNGRCIKNVLCNDYLLQRHFPHEQPFEWWTQHQIDGLMFNCHTMHRS